MAKNKLSGNILGLEIDGNFVACETSCELSYEVELRGASPETSGRWKEWIPGVRSWSINLNAVALLNTAGASYNTVLDAFLSGARLRLRFKSKNVSKSTFVVSGYAYVQTGGMGAPVNASTTWTVTFMGDGPLEAGDKTSMIVQYGFIATDPFGHELDLQPQFAKDFVSGASSIPLDFTRSSQGNYLFAIVPLGQNIFNVWENSQFNFGEVPDFAWREPVIVGTNTYYMSRSPLYITGTVPVIVFKNKNTKPDPFYFVSVADAALNTVYLSNTVTITGITEPVEISILDGEYSINGGSFTNVLGYVNSSDTVMLRQTSSSGYNTKTDTTVTIGGVSAVYSVTTQINSTLYYAYNADLFVKSGCTYGSPALAYSKTYTSTISQATADALRDADLATFMAEGQANADLNGVCSSAPKYIWGVITSADDMEVYGGLVYATCKLKTYAGGTATNPPTNLNTPIACTNYAIDIEYVSDSPSVIPLGFTISMSNQSEVIINPMVTPVYPKQVIETPSTRYWFVFTGKLEGAWALLQVVN